MCADFHMLRGCSSHDRETTSYVASESRHSRIRLEGPDVVCKFLTEHAEQ